MVFDRSQPQPDPSRSLGSDLVFFGRVSQALALVCLGLGIRDAVVAWAVRDCGKGIQARSAWRPEPLLKFIDVPRRAHHGTNAR